MAKTMDELNKVKAQIPTGLPKKHPLLDQENHDLLLQYCKKRIDMAVEAQRGLQERYEIIDRDLAGFLELDQKDKKRRQDNIKGKDPKPTKVKPQMVLTQLMRGVTYLASVFTPDASMFRALASADEQQIANAFAEAMNKQAQNYQYFRQQCIFFLNCLKYNAGGVIVEWDQTFGKVLEGASTGVGTQVTEKLRHDGNKMTALDMYNTFWDPAVHPCDVHAKAEFAGDIRMITPYALYKMIADGDICNTDDIVTNKNTTPQWYCSTPQVRFNIDASGTRQSNGQYNWANILTAGMMDKGVAEGFEETNLYIRLLPSDFNLVSTADAKKRMSYELWRITIINGTKIVATEWLNNVHDQIPMFFGVPVEDNLGLQSKSIGENLVPFQEFGAFLLNTHIDATRKNIWDLIIYDPTMVDLNAIGDDVAARVPMAPTGYGKDITKAVFHVSSNLDTKETLAQFEKVMEFMEFFFPTRMQQMVADIQRATTNQVAATVQASSRESWKMARLLEDQAMNPSRFVMVSNMCQYQSSIKIRIGKEVVEVDASKFRDAGIEYRLGAGLRDVDRMMKQEFVKELINTILQTQAFSEFDVPGLIGYLSQYLGAETDLSQFRKLAPPTGTLAPQKGPNPADGGGETAPNSAGAGGEAQ